MSKSVRVAVVGSGPAGFYAAEELLDCPHDVLVDMYERLPVPFGLVRSGVAPDHQKLKSVTTEYDQIARRQGFRFIGNVKVGVDIQIDQLAAAYHAIILATGAEADRVMGIPGEDLEGSYSARDFVHWYNGHPDFADHTFDLSGPVAVVIGNGNVAVDVCRILLKSVDELKASDIAAHALEALAKSEVREVHLFGRRGSAQTKITNKELHELINLPEVELIVDQHELTLNAESLTELEDRQNFNNALNVKALKECAGGRSSKDAKGCQFHFLRSPLAIQGQDKVKSIVLGINRLTGDAFEQVAADTSERETFACDMVFRSIGYWGTPLSGVDFDDRKGRIPNERGRVKTGLYVTGWIKRGPTGVIGTNRADAIETVATLIDDLPNLMSATKASIDGIFDHFRSCGTRIVSFADWQQIDRAEQLRGLRKGKPREKFIRIDDMLRKIDDDCV